MKKIWIIIGILVVIIAGAAYLNAGSLKSKKASQDNATFTIKSGDQTCTVDMNSIKNMGKQTFDANLKSNGKAPVKHTYTGVPLKTIFENKKINTNGKTKVIVKAADGYTSAITMNEAMDDSNVYIVYEIDGKSLGKKENGGSGPFEMIIRNDQFSQRWCKFVLEVDVQ